VLVGSREQFEAMTKFLEAEKIKPIIGKVFEFEDAQKAYEYQ